MGRSDLKTFLIVGLKGLSIYILISATYAIFLQYALNNVYFIMIGALSSIIGNWVLSDTLYLERNEPKGIILNSVIGLSIILISFSLYARYVLVEN